MIDTIKLHSPEIPEEEARQVESFLERFTRVDCKSGLLIFQLTAGHLAGSFDHRLSVKIERDRWSESGTKTPCGPYLAVEGSVHKQLLGHNVFGGPEEFKPAARWLVARLGDLLGVCLPEADNWIPRRIDVAEAFDLGSFDAVQDYISGLNMETYPRRKVNRYGNESLVSIGQVSTVKVYHKGPEVWKHDRARLRSVFGDSEAFVITERANGIMRTEVELKSKWLREHFGKQATVSKVVELALCEGHDGYISRLVKEGQCAMETVRTHKAVQQRLTAMYGTTRTGLLLGTWFRLAGMGEIETRKSMSRPTFYRQRAQLLKAGCAWDGTDVVLIHCSSIPSDFSLRRDSRYRLKGESEEVRLQLQDYRSAA